MIAEEEENLYIMINGKKLKQEEQFFMESEVSDTKERSVIIYCAINVWDK